MSSLATVSLSPCSAAISSRTGATILQGPHQVAQKSTTTGLSLPRTSSAKVASVTVTGALMVGRTFRWTDVSVGGADQDGAGTASPAGSDDPSSTEPPVPRGPMEARPPDPTPTPAPSTPGVGGGTVSRTGVSACSASQRSASIEAWQPLPAAVTACR